MTLKDSDISEAILRAVSETLVSNYDLRRAVIHAFHSILDKTSEDFEKRIADALGTDERGNALIEVANNAHKAEQKLAAITRAMEAAE